MFLREILMMKYSDQQLMDIIQKRLSPNRYRHSLQVAQVARDLAEQYGVDPGKAYATGLLHDYAKGMSGQELLDRAEIYQLMEHPADSLLPDLLHGPVGAYLVKQELGIEDEEMLAAIAPVSYTHLTKLAYHQVDQAGVTPKRSPVCRGATTLSPPHHAIRLSRIGIGLVFAGLLRSVRIRAAAAHAPVYCHRVQ